MANSTINMSTIHDLPPLPSYTLTPVKPLIPYISDFILSLILPIATYWIVSLIFHFIDTHDIWPQYRLHTPAEITQRNHVSRYEVARDVIIQQVIQVGMGAVLGLTEPEQMYGKEEYDVARWAQRLRIAQRALPQLLGLVGLNAAAISQNVSGSHPIIAAVLAGGKYPGLTGLEATGSVPAFATWEMVVAKAIYWYIVPVMQLFLAVVVLDTWQYFLHRAMHMNKWLYSGFPSSSLMIQLISFLATFHSRHHRLYVPYAYGALYNHPFEGFLLDTLGASVAYKCANLTARQGLLFFVGSSIKTVDDHCGYAFPWDPLQHITSNNATYHDIHHQSWGIKTNFSQPFFTFWDGWLGTMWTGETKGRYERTRKAAQFKEDAAKLEL